LSTRRRALSNRTSFWVATAAYVALMMAAGAPTSLYVTYQERWHFSEVTLTLIFGIYVLVLLATLLTVGGLSDFVGRKPVLLTGLLLLIASMAIFANARGVGWLYAGRVVQGLAAGTSLGALSAAIIDYAGPSRSRLAAMANSFVPSLGLALGTVIAGALVQFAPAPRMLIFVVLSALYVVLVVAIAAAPETAVRRPGALRSLVPRIRVPRHARAAFFGTLPAQFAPWAQLGMALSLTTSLAADKFGVTNKFLGALVVFAMLGSAFLAGLLTRNVRPQLSTYVGCGGMVIGNVIILLSLIGPSTIAFYAGSIFTGLAIGMTLGAVLGALSALPTAAERGEFFASVYVIGYIAFSVPAIIAGYCAVHVGLVPTSVGYGLFLIVLILLAMINLKVLGSRVGAPEPTADEAASIAHAQPIHG
jgi:MFS family permease